MIRNIVLAFTVLIAFSCKGQDKEVVEKIKVSSEEVGAMVSFLASDDIKGRDTGSEGIAEAATYIEKHLESFGVKPYYDTYRDNFKVKELDAYNVVGYLEGTDPKLKNEVVVIGAHYDHIGLRARPVENDSIGNGANDNATGTATVLAMAKYFGTAKNNKRSIVFAQCTAEEMGLLGSKHLSERMKNDDVNLYTMVNFEIMGVPFPDRYYQVFATGYDLSNMAEVLNKYAGNKLVGKSDEAAKFNLFKRSDNYPFYAQFKMAAQTISSCDLTNFDFYHHADDEADLMDYNHMSSTIKNLFTAMEGMITSSINKIKFKE